jgi:cytochrome b involved in lipid metabolism
MRPLVPAEFNIFDSITGLPMHPLVVHFAVVLLPLAAIMLIALFFVPKWRAAFAWLTMAGLIAGTAAAYVAKQTGEAFAAHVGLPQDHAVWGDALVVVAVLLVIAAGAWFWLLRPVETGVAKGRAPATRAVGIVAVALAAAATVMTVIVGHSGATAVWEGRLNPVQAPEISTSAPASTGATTYTLDQVKAHATPSDCWSVVAGTVYNLTAWIPRHEGGQAVIKAMCGIDATASFAGQHGKQGEPNQALKRYAIGTIGSGQQAASTAPSAGKTITLAEIQQHASGASCWAAVNGKVYDLTKWINNHPGGSNRILGMCGKDATSAFQAQHGAADPAVGILGNYLIGSLG